MERRFCAARTFSFRLLLSSGFRMVMLAARQSMIGWEAEDGGGYSAIGWPHCLAHRKRAQYPELEVPTMAPFWRPVWPRIPIVRLHQHSP